MNENLPELSSQEEPSAAPLIDHLIELRNRMLIAAGAYTLGIIFCYLIADSLFAALTAPLRETVDGSTRRLIFTSLPEAFLTKIRLAFFGGFLVAFPVISTQLYRFIAPGLYANEKKALRPFFILAPLLFYAGASLAYFFVFPTAWQFFVSFEQPKGEVGLPLQLEAKVSEYLSLIIQIILAFGLCFQLPVVLNLLVRVGVFSIEGLRRKRRYAIVIMLIIAAILTPPDVISQIALFTVLYILYEGSILWGARTGSSRNTAKEPPCTTSSG